MNIDASIYKVRRRLHDRGLHRYTSACKEKLTARHRASRVQFSEQHLDWGIVDWAKVIFSDEKTFSLTGHGKLRTYNTRYNQSNTHEKA